MSAFRSKACFSDPFAHRNDKHRCFKRRCYNCYCAGGFPSLLGFQSLNVPESGPGSVSPVSRIHGGLEVDSGDVQPGEVKSTI